MKEDHMFKISNFSDNVFNLVAEREMHKGFNALLRDNNIKYTMLEKVEEYPNGYKSVYIFEDTKSSDDVKDLLIEAKLIYY